MGDALAHVRKAKHNETFLNVIQKSDPNSISYPDWMVTVAFYIALHYVDAALAKLKPPKHPQNHPARNRFVNLYLPSDIAQYYLYLYNQSKIARYFPDSEKRISPVTVQRCINLALTRFSSI